MLIAQGAPGADVMERTLRDMPFTGTDQRAELLRAACGEALRRDGIPAGVEQRARDFYERGRGRGHRHGAQPAAPAVSAATTRYEPVQPSGSPDVVNAIVNALRRLFGRS
jgi:hypothetical protein